MSNVKLTDLPVNAAPSSAALAYIVDGGASYQTNLFVLTGSFNNSGNLQSTGTSLQNQIYGLSGQFNLSGSNAFNFSTGVSGNLISTGANLISIINGLSGQVNITGSNLFRFVTGVSGNLIATGSNLYNLITNLSGNLNLTGTNLQNQINSLSGNLNTTGNNLINIINGLSGNLNQTGLNILGYSYVKAAIVSGGTNTANSFSLVGTPTAGNNIIPANGFKIGDVYYGEFTLNINDGSTSDGNMAIQIQNNLITGAITTSSSFSKTLFCYKFMYYAVNSLLFTAYTIGGGTNQPPFFPPSSSTKICASGLTIDATQSTTIDLIGKFSSSGINYMIADYSFLKKF